MGEIFNQWMQHLIDRDCEDRSSSKTLRESAAIDVDLYPAFSLRESAAPVAEFLMQRAFSNSILSRERPSGDNHHTRQDGSRGMQTLVFTTTMRPSTRGPEPSRTDSPTRPAAKKECPICREMVGEPKQCFAAPENGSAVATCCVCGEEKDMRTERVVLACMHPLCATCFERMPSA